MLRRPWRAQGQEIGLRSDFPTGVPSSPILVRQKSCNEGVGGGWAAALKVEVGLDATQKLRTEVPTSTERRWDVD
jgi:hypothetical protein